MTSVLGTNEGVRATLQLAGAIDQKRVSVATRPSRLDRVIGSINAEERSKDRFLAPIGGFSTICPSTTS